MSGGLVFVAIVFILDDSDSDDAAAAIQQLMLLLIVSERCSCHTIRSIAFDVILLLLM